MTPAWLSDPTQPALTRRAGAVRVRSEGKDALGLAGGGRSWPAKPGRHERGEGEMPRARFIVALIATALLCFDAPAALAAAPANDDFSAATSIEALPFHTALDSSEATTAPDDPLCAGNGASLWYSFTPSADVIVDADTFGSDYDTTLSAWRGTRGSLTAVACDDDTNGLQSQIEFRASAGVTYFLMAASYGSRGGNLVLSAAGSDPGPPPPPSRTFFRFRSDPGDLVGQGQTRMFTPADSSFDARMANYDNDPSDRQFRATIRPIAGDYWFVNLAAPPGEALVPGTYPDAVRLGLEEAGQAGMDIYGYGGCSRLTGSFTVRSLSLASDGSIRLFDATFEQRCEPGFTGALRGRIKIDNRPPNAPPDCSGVTASRSVLWPPRRAFVPVVLSGATDPDGDSVTYAIDDVTQDEAVRSTGDRTSPDARPGADEGAVELRAERSPKGEGRVYQIAFTVRDAEGESCSGQTAVGVPRRPHQIPRDSSPPSYDSSGR
jgi:hypothetical protein